MRTGAMQLAAMLISAAVAKTRPGDPALLGLVCFAARGPNAW